MLVSKILMFVYLKKKKKSTEKEKYGIIFEFV